MQMLSLCEVLAKIYWGAPVLQPGTNFRFAEGAEGTTKNCRQILLISDSILLQSLDTL